ncbi:MAG: hypothetical protein IT428_06010 [Planctomycetaceae bacterium]|nr:hypothetical protein [Planctomycetaceae bacterium]
MFSNLDYYCGMAMAFVAACLAVLAGTFALHGWFVVLFTTPDMWDVALAHYQQSPSVRDYLAIEVYACPVLAWLCGWLAMLAFRGR